MVIKLYIRNSKESRGRCTMRVDYKNESDDNVRISNLGLDIVNQLQDMIDRCEADGTIKA